VRVCQDDLGSCEECKKLVAKSLKGGRSVIVDRCNASQGDRKIWITEAKRQGAKQIEVVYFDVPAEECVRRASNRRKHPTLSGGNAEEVIQSFSGSFAPPTQYEGFTNVTIVATDQEIRQEIKRLKELFPKKGKKKK